MHQPPVVCHITVSVCNALLLLDKLWVSSNGTLQNGAHTSTHELIRSVTLLSAAPAAAAAACPRGANLKLLITSAI